MHSNLLQILLNCFKRKGIKKSVEATGDLIGNEIAVEMPTKFLKTSPQNNSETVPNEEENIGFDRKIPKE